MIFFVFVFTVLNIEHLSAASDTANCSNYQGKQYCFVQEPMNYSSADLHCLSLNMSMVSIDSLELNEWLSKNSDSQNGHVWIGLNDLNTESKFVWINGSELASNYQNWNESQPDDSRQNEDCVHLKTNGKWNDLPCFKENKFICERPVEVVEKSSNQLEAPLISEGKSAIQVHTTRDNVADRAVDGITNQIAKFCSFTQLDKNPWWQVDLGSSYHITRLSIYTNKQYEGPNFDGALLVSVGHSTNEDFHHCVSGPATITLGQIVNLDADCYGRFVKIILPGNNKYLGLCEVKIYGFPDTN